MKFNYFILLNLILAFTIVSLEMKKARQDYKPISNCCLVEIKWDTSDIPIVCSKCENICEIKQ